MYSSNVVLVEFEKVEFGIKLSLGIGACEKKGFNCSYVHSRSTLRSGKLSFKTGDCGFDKSTADSSKYEYVRKPKAVAIAVFPT